MIYALNYRETPPERALILNVTSKGTDWAKNLSPFILGPIITEYGVSKNVENAWQFSKVYTKMGHWNSDMEQPTETWWDWNRGGLSDSYAHRYPAGKGTIPLGSWSPYRGLMGYAEAKRYIYMPLYLQALRASNYYPQFVDTVRFSAKAGVDLVFKDFDVFDHRKRGLDIEDIIDADDVTLGHGFVLLMEAERWIN